MNDPKAAPQLTHGFYAVEDNAWRWVGSKFGVVLVQPEGASAAGAKVTMKFTLADFVLRDGPINLAATANGMAQTPQKYDKPGAYTYTFDLSPQELGTGPVKVEFVSDRGIVGQNGDKRELALIVQEIDLTKK
jgi:hypothetical protein